MPGLRWSCQGWGTRKGHTLEKISKISIRDRRRGCCVDCGGRLRRVTNTGRRGQFNGEHLECRHGAVARRELVLGQLRQWAVGRTRSFTRRRRVDQRLDVDRIPRARRIVAIGCLRQRTLRGTLINQRESGGARLVERT